MEVYNYKEGGFVSYLWIVHILMDFVMLWIEQCIFVIIYQSAAISVPVIAIKDIEIHIKHFILDLLKPQEL